MPLRPYQPRDASPVNALAAQLDTNLPQRGEVLAKNGWVIAHKGRVIGYGYVEAQPQARQIWLQGGVESTTPPMLVAQLINRLCQRGQQIAPTAEVMAWTSPTHQAYTTALLACGFVPEHVYTELRLDDLDQPFADFPLSLPTITIQPWHDSYADAAAQLRNLAFADSWGYQPTSGPALRRHFRTGRYQPEHSWVALEAQTDTLAGVVHTVFSPATSSAEIVWIAAHPPFQGQGLGRLLLNTAIRELKQEVTTITLSADHHADRVNLNLYLKHGFTITHRVTDYRWSHFSQPSAKMPAEL